MQSSIKIASVVRPWVRLPQQLIDSLNVKKIGFSAACLTQIRFKSNRSRRGLYDGRDIRSGNNVSHSERKTKRKFKPNVFVKRVYSETLDEMIRFRLTTSALRTIDKVGGLDNYLLNSKNVFEGTGLAVKKRILEKVGEPEGISP